jgi:hypothetical protein
VLTAVATDIPMTEQLFKDDSYLRHCNATVLAAADDAIVLDRTVFYALGGGQPGDTGSLSWYGDSIDVVDTRYGETGEIRHLVSKGSNLPEPGTAVTATLDWDRRYLHMRMHTALHLLGAVLNFGVTGGNVSATKSRLDFDMEDSVDKDQVSRSAAVGYQTRSSPQTPNSCEQCPCNRQSVPDKYGYLKLPTLIYSPAAALILDRQVRWVTFVWAKLKKRASEIVVSQFYWISANETKQEITSPIR